MTLGEKIGGILILAGIAGLLCSIVFTSIAIPCLIITGAGIVTYAISTIVTMS